MSELRNYIGGTIANPCPTGPSAFKVFGSLYCNAEDYAAWKLRLKVMYTQAILPTWEAYVAAMGGSIPDGDPLWQRVERFRLAYEQLPEASAWLGFAKSARYSQQAIAVGQDGEQVIDLLQDAITTAGAEPPAFPEGPVPMPTEGKNPLTPWFWGLGIGAVVAGLGVYAATRGGK